MQFKFWLDHVEDEWTIEELIPDIHSANSSVNIEGTPPDYCDPDDLYNRGGIFSFTYSLRKILKKNELVPERLVIAPSGLTHRYLVGLNYSGDNYHILSGRYGIKDSFPIVAFWANPNNSLLIMCLKELKNLVHAESLVYINGENNGSIQIRIKNPSKVQKITIGSKEYNLFDLPALLHSLSSASAEHKNIRDFICTNHEKYPFLNQFLGRARCVEPNQNYEIESSRRKRYWATSESLMSITPDEEL